ncbi:MAG: hypothetical protein Q7T78_05035 [Rhodoferax sp.]|nr:hypothetical protein [Rhodoferax sp.]
MHLKPQNLALALASAALLTLAGCGGGSGTTPIPPAAAAPTTAVPITVIDGAIFNAKVCIDTNTNGQCDAGETFAMTKADGSVVLDVPVADVGKYPIVAVVGTDAVDADHGPVKTPFTMQAPADKSAVVSPLTTLIQTLVATTGATSAQAEASVKAQTGLNISLFEDFTKGTTTDSKIAGTVARMVVVTTQQQSTALASALGTSAIDGTVIAQADLNKLIQNKLLEILPALVTALADPSVRDATTPAATEAALLAQANTLVASPDTGLTSSAVATLVAVNNQTATASTVAETPAAGGNLRQLNFSNASNWSSRINVQTAAQATPDSSGFTRSVQRRYSSNSGNIAAWTSIGSSPNRQADLHFNGSSWVGCALNSEDKNTARDAQGNATYNTCDNFETGKTNRASFDVANRSMLEVYNQIRAAGYSNITISNASTVLGTTTFPANSKVLYQSTSSFANAAAYYPGIGNYAVQALKSVTDGGVASTQASGTACNLSNPGETPSTTLEGMVASRTGTPCIYGQGQFIYAGVTYTSPDLNDEVWGNTTMGIGIVGTAPTGTGAAPGYYSGNTWIRLAFTGSGANPVTYYACKQRFNNGSSRQCKAIGTGSYTIAAMGGARVMTLSNPPPAASSLGYQRVFVERAGKIYLGYQNNAGTFNSARLNLTATNALFGKLGLATVNPDTPLALTRTSYAGEWELSVAAAPLEPSIMRVLNDGSTNCTDINLSSGVSTNKACSLTFTDLATGTFTYSDATGTASGAFNFLTGAASGTYIDTSTTPSSTGSFTGSRR